MPNVNPQSDQNSSFHPIQMISELRSTNNENAIGKLLDRYRNYLKLMARSQINPQLNARFDPSDVVQETYLEAHQGFGNFRGRTEKELMAWLRKILARNICDHARKHCAQQRDVNRERSLETDLDRSSMQLGNALGAEITSPSHRAVQREQAVVVADAIANLSDEQREVILLRQMHRIPFEEIGKKLGKSSGAVRMIWLRSLERLKKSIDQSV